MKVRLTWDDFNYGTQGFNVYRDTQPIDENSLPAPLASLGPDTREYEDDTVIGNKKYHYRVSALVDGVEKLTVEREVLTTGIVIAEFTDVGSFEWEKPEGVNEVDVLVVAGGGGAMYGGGNTALGGAGGGGVEVLTNFPVAGLSVIQGYVGDGGRGAIDGTTEGGPQVGEDSSFSTVIAIGGGRGSGWASSDLENGGDGGSGGGGAGFTKSGTGVGGTGVSGQGHNGGDGAGSNTSPSRRAAGGGGGAGEPGGHGISQTYSIGGKGGDGVYVPWASNYGDDGWFGGGGGGGVTSSSTSAIAGEGGKGGGGEGSRRDVLPEGGKPNTGGGAGGGGPYETTGGKKGGSGIVLIRYSIPLPEEYDPLPEEPESDPEPLVAPEIIDVIPVED